MTREHERIVRKADQVIDRAEQTSHDIRALLLDIRSTEGFVERFVERRRKNRGHTPERRRRAQPRTNGAKA